MPPWRISARLTASIVGATFLGDGFRFEYLRPFWPLIFADHGVSLAMRLAFAVITVATAIYPVTRATPTGRYDAVEGGTPSLPPCSAETPRAGTK